MAGKPSLQMYPGDWFKAEEVRACSPNTRGIWIDIIFYAFNSQSYGAVSGTVPSLARRCSATIEEMEQAIDEIELHNVGDVSRSSNGVVTVVCRRLRREQEERDGNAEYMRDYRARKAQEGAGGNGAESERKQDVSSDVSESNSDVNGKKEPCTSRSRAEDEVEVEGLLKEEPYKVNTSNRARVRGQPEEQELGMQIYREFYPDERITNYQKDLINHCRDPDALRAALQFWKGNDYIGKNVKTILEKAEEISSESADGETTSLDNFA